MTEKEPVIGDTLSNIITLPHKLFHNHKISLEMGRDGEIYDKDPDFPHAVLNL
jgi:hypothetical protein